MKGDPHIFAKCPFCPHKVRPRPRRDENGYIKVTTTAAVLRNAMRAHINSAHPGISQRRVTETLKLFTEATVTTQMQLMDPTPAARALMPCPVPGCDAILQTWVNSDDGNIGYVAAHAIRQHLNHKHPDLSPRDKRFYIDTAQFKIVENGAGPGRPPQGPGAGGPALLDLVAPSRPDEQAHASGKVEEHSDLRIHKRSETIIVQTSTA